VLLAATAAVAATPATVGAAAAAIGAAGVLAPPAGGRRTIASLLCSHVQILFSSCVRGAITAPVQPRWHRRRRQPRDRGPCCRRGWTRRSRRRRHVRAPRPVHRRCGPSPTSAALQRAVPPPCRRP